MCLLIKLCWLIFIRQYNEVSTRSYLSLTIDKMINKKNVCTWLPKMWLWRRKQLSKIEIPITTIREIFLRLNSFAVNVNVKICIRLSKWHENENFTLINPDSFVKLRLMRWTFVESDHWIIQLFNLYFNHLFLLMC